MENSQKIKISEKLKEIVTELSFPRFSGSKNVEKAENIVLKYCNSLQIKPITENFKASPFYMSHIIQVPYFIIGILMLFVSITIFFKMSTILLLILSIILIFLGFNVENILQKIKYPVLFSRFAKTHESKNIILNPKFLKNENNNKKDNDNTLGYQNEKKSNIFILAHIDSKSENPNPRTWFLVEYISTQLGTLIFSIHLFIYSVFSIFSQNQLLHNPWIFLYGIIFGVLDMMRIFTKYFEGESCGANDDAIGVAICLLLQHFVDKTNYKNIRITNIITGSEELGEIGTYSFIKSHQKEIYKDKDHFIAIDGITGKNIYYFNKRGLTFKKFSPLIGNVLKNMIDSDNIYAKNINLIKMWMPPPVNTDHSPVVNMGYNAFLFASPEKVSHTKEDTPDKIDFIEVEAFFEFLINLFDEIDTSLGI